MPKSTAADHAVCCKFVITVSNRVFDARLYPRNFLHFRLIRTSDILGLIMCKNSMLNN